MSTSNASDESPRNQLTADIMDLSPSDIADRKSVRTTFRMTQQAYEALSSLARLQGISLKETIHFVANVAEALLKGDAPDDANEMIQALFDALRKPPQGPTKRRSQVASRGALRRLNAAAETHHVPRDRVLEVMLLVVRQAVENECEAMNEKLRKAQEIVRDAQSHCENAETKLRRLLPKNHAVVNRMGFAVIDCMNLEEAIKTELQGGSPVDPQDSSQTE